MKFAFAAAAVLSLATVPAHAGEVRVRVLDSRGGAVDDAVVTINTGARAAPGSIRFPWPMIVAQRNIQFDPRVLIVPVGATVHFPNFDKVRHHVYSFSKAAKFDIKLFSRDETRSYTFSTVGAVAIGCNIHDQMSGFIRVVDTPYAAKTASGGYATLASVPAGKARITVWHSRMRAKDQESSFDIDIPASGQIAKLFTVALK